MGSGEAAAHLSQWLQTQVWIPPALSVALGGYGGWCWLLSSACVCGELSCGTFLEWDVLAQRDRLPSEAKPEMRCPLLWLSHHEQNGPHRRFIHFYTSSNMARRVTPKRFRVISRYLQQAFSLKHVITSLNEHALKYPRAVHCCALEHRIAQPCL